MSNSIVPLALLCCVIGCSTLRHDRRVASVPGPARPGQSMRLVVITEAPAFALLPRVVENSYIVIPLPAERAHLANVKVNLLVTRRDTDEIMDQQSESFDWRTQGTSLRFFLPELPDGDFVAQIRTTSTVLTADGGAPKEIQLSDQAQVSFHLASEDSVPASQAQVADGLHASSRFDGHYQAPQVYQFDYHFERHASLGDAPALVPEEVGILDNSLKTVFKNNVVIKVTLDCWASSDGDSDYNMQVSQKRCAWVRSNILQKALNADAQFQVIEAAHGEDNLPAQESMGFTDRGRRGAQMHGIQKKNRVVILKVYAN